METMTEDLTELKGYELQEAVEKIRRGSKGLTFEQYRTKMQPYIDEINRRGREIAKKHGKKYHALTFSELR